MKENRILLIVVVVAVGVFVAYSAAIWLIQQKFDEINSKFPPPPGPEAPIITYEKNESTRTITITSIEGEIEEYSWKDVELYDKPGMNFSEAALPNGTIDVGDVITDCEGLVYLWWIPTGEVLLTEIFD